MATSQRAQSAQPSRRRTDRRRPTTWGSQGLVSRLKPVAAKLGAFWQKLSNDWTFNLSGLLAYNFLMSIFPILLVLLAVAGLVLRHLSPASYQAFVLHLGHALPGGSAIVHAVVSSLSKSGGLVLVIGVITAIFTGSRLFITIENCFGVVFRLRGRDVVPQNLMAIGMLLLYVLLVPLLFLASILPTAIDNALFPAGGGGFLAFLVQVAGIVLGALFAAVLFGAIYVVVPNRPVRWREVWRGTLVAAILLVLYEFLFPIYESHFLRPGNMGALAGFAIVILVFLYYLGFILLVGAEVNSWASGQRQTAGDVPALFHEVQAHNTTRGAAGPTAGTVQEDVQSRTGSEAMRTPAAIAHEREAHHADIKPPRYAEAGLEGQGPTAAQPDSPAFRQQTEQVERQVQGHGKGRGDEHVRRQRQTHRSGQGRREEGPREAASTGSPTAVTRSAPSRTGPRAEHDAASRSRRPQASSPVVGAVTLGIALLVAWMASRFGARRPSHPDA